MPFIKIYYNDKLSNKILPLISNSIHEALKENFLIPKKDIFHLFQSYKDTELIVDDTYLLTENKTRSHNLLYIDILCGNGRSNKQKRFLFSSISENIYKTTSIKPDDIFITIKESPKENWSFGEGISQLMDTEQSNE